MTDCFSHLKIQAISSTSNRMTSTGCLEGKKSGLVKYQIGDSYVQGQRNEFHQKGSKLSNI
jgi:hypothetical protein